MTISLIELLRVRLKGANSMKLRAPFSRPRRLVRLLLLSEIGGRCFVE